MSGRGRRRDSWASDMAAGVGARRGWLLEAVEVAISRPRRRELEPHDCPSLWRLLCAVSLPNAIKLLVILRNQKGFRHYIGTYFVCRPTYLSKRMAAKPLC